MSMNWTQIPDDLLDLGKARETADTWAAQQRQKVADVWAQTQRSLLDAAVNRWREQASAVTQPSMMPRNTPDQAGSADSPASSPGLSTPGYNDMVGASSGPSLNGASLQGTPPGIQAPGFQAPQLTTDTTVQPYNDMAGASPQPDYSKLPGMGGVQPQEGANPLVNVPAAIGQRIGDTAQEYNAAYTPTLPSQPGHGPLARFTPAQIQAQQELATNAVLGVQGEAPKVVGEAAGPVVAKAGEAAQEVGGSLIGKAKDAVTRMFHGTGSAFDAPEAAKFDPNGLFGPGYYLTSDARVADSYAETRGAYNNDQVARQLQWDKEDLAKLQADPYGAGVTDRIARLQDNIAYAEKKLSGAPNVRAVNVPQGLKLLDAEATPMEDAGVAVNRIDQSFGNDAEGRLQRSKFFNELVSLPGDHPTGLGIYQTLLNATGERAETTRILQAAGYDGIRYNGGARIPLADENGAPIQHTAVVIFPDSLPKITNAISGRPMGSPPAVGGAVVGGVYGASQPAENDQERAKNIVGYGLGGALLGRGLEAAGRGERLPLGGSIEDVTRTGAAGEIPHPGTAEAGTPPTGTSPPTTATPPPLEPDARAGNILLRKYASPDVQQVIADAAARDPQAMEAARRGVVSDQTVQDLADAVGQNVDKIVKRWKPGNAVNAETITALRTALDGKAQEVVDAQKAFQAGGDSTANALRLQVAIREHQAVQQVVSGGSAELGRGLRALRQNVTQAIQSGDAAKMGEILKKLGGREWTDELAAKLGQLDTSDPTQVHTFLRDMAKPKAADRVNEWLYNAILSNPATHVANTVSNTMNALGGVIERGTAAAIDVPLAAIQGRPRGRFLGEAGADAYGLLQGIPEGVRQATYALQHGFTEEEALKGEMPRMQAFRGPIGNVINAPSRALNAADAFMRPILQRGALNALIYRQAVGEGLRGQALTNRITELTTNVPATLMNQAAKTAEYQLYRQEPKTLAQGLTKLRGLKVAGIEPLRFVLPFVQVPVNATKYGLERSPLGLLNPDLWKNLAAKDPAAADQLARVAQGSFIAAGIGALIGSGNLDITGAAPTAPAQRDAFYRQGKLPFALKIGGTWYQYQRWEPMNHPLTQVAAAVDAIRNAKEGMPPTGIAAQAGLTIAQNIASQSFLSGINSLMNAASDPQRYGSQLLQQMATAPLPFSAGMRAAANVVDPRQRAPSGALQDVESAIPGLSQNVPARLNNYGEGETQPGTPLLPYKWQAANNSPIEAELARFKVEPGATGKTLRGIDLAPDEARAHQVVAGQQVKQYLTQLVNDPRYSQLTDAQKAKALQIAITRAKDLAARQYVGQLVQQQGQAAILKRIQQKKLVALPKAG